VGEGIRRQLYKEGQPRFQAGFDWDGHPNTLAAFQTRLTSQTGIRILPCFGKYIDVLPDPVGKGGAVRFLGGELGLSADRIVVAGDSGNDREMFETGFKGILPVNALDELKTIANQPWHFKSPLPAALGILDGLRYFDFI
jgi:hydroxymethylpyrimidine pyrophosphatase-like HAD family hydrolase